MTSVSHKPLGRFGLGAYAAPSLPEAMILYAASMVIAGYYADKVGLSTAFIGTVYLVSRLFDAVTDPLIGILSDKTRSPLGARKPWLIAGTLLCVFAVYFLYVPNLENPAPRYLVATLALYLGWTMAIVPYDAWGVELSRNYTQRNRIFTYRAIGYYLGAILFLVSPMLPMFSGEFDAEVLKFNALLIAVIFSLATMIAVFGAPKAEVSQTQNKPTFKAMFEMMKANRPLQYFIALHFLGGISLGITIALTYTYVVNYLKLPDKLALVLFFYVLANFIAVPFWALVLRYLQKHKAWALGLIGWSLCYPPIVILTPGTAHAAGILLCLTTLSGFLYSVANITSKSLLGDVIDYDTLKSGENHSGAIFAIGAFINKANVALGGGFAFLMLSIFHYVPASESNSPTAVFFGLKFTFLILPTFIALIGAYMLWRFPIDQRRHEIISRRLEGCANRKPAL